MAQKDFTIKDLEALLAELIADGDISDVLFSPFETPLVHRGDQAVKLSNPCLTKDQIYNIAKQLLDSKLIDIDDISSKQISYMIEHVGRFRVSIVLGNNGYHIMFRLIPLETRTFKELNLPKQLSAIAQSRSGLVLVTGATGQGKSTTISAMIRDISVNKYTSILTLEDPMEFVYRNGLSVILQREVGSHVPDLKAGLKDAMRHKPRIIMVGEILDGEHFELVLQAAESGHLVLSTLHSENVVTSMDRMLSLLSNKDPISLRARLARTLTAVITQRLLPSERKEAQLVPAVEIYRKNPGGTEHIKNGDFPKLFDLMQKEGELINNYPKSEDSDKYLGMQTFDQDIRRLLDAGWIDLDTALSHATNPNEFKLKQMLAGAWVQNEADEDED